MTFLANPLLLVILLIAVFVIGFVIGLCLGAPEGREDENGFQYAKPKKIEDQSQDQSWQCGCGYLVPDEVIRAALVDLPCPGCGNKISILTAKMVKSFKVRD